MKGETAYKILEWERNETLDGEEYKAVIERVRSDGGKALQRIFTRKVDTGSSYTVFTHLAFGEGGMSQTIIVSGQKGQVSGNTRADQVETVLISSDGTVHRQPKRTVEVLLENPFKGLSPDELLNRIGSDVRERLRQLGETGRQCDLKS